MQTLTQILDANNPKDIDLAVSLLKQDKIVALPTETVYGLAANALSVPAVNKIFAAKNRPTNNPLIWHVHDQEAAKNLLNWDSFSPDIQKRFSLLAKTYWPGPLTIIASARPDLIKYTNNLSTIAVRIPRNNITQKILKLLNTPLVMPSANISTRPSPTLGSHVLKTLENRIDAILDAGSCDVGIESSVIRIDQKDLKILRPGIISAEEISYILNEPVITNLNNFNTIESPGLGFKHYAPEVQNILLISREKINYYWPTKASIICRREDLKFFDLKTRPKTALTFILPDNPEYYARELYNALYSAENNAQENLIIIDLPQEQAWNAIRDRLERSAGIKQLLSDQKH